MVRTFYREHADSFSDSRASPWPGWRRLLDEADRRLAENPTVRALDVGCGNGRFIRALADRLKTHARRLEIIGLEPSDELLSIARRRLADLAEVEGLQLDLLAGELPVTAPSAQAASVERSAGGPPETQGTALGTFDLIALLAVLHHVPGMAARHALMRRLGDHLTPNGILAVSIWRFDRDPAFLRRRVPWTSLEPVVATDQLEANDHLLSWQGDRSALRYCHLVDDAETDALIKASGLRLLSCWEADGASGRSNAYLLLGQ